MVPTPSSTSQRLPLRLAGFQVSTTGRFWVSPEVKTRLSRKGLTPKAKKRGAGSVAHSAKAPARDDNKASQVRPGDPVVVQGVGSRGAPPVPSGSPGTFSLREDSKDI